MKDLWGEALLDYHLGVQQGPLILHTSFGEPEVVPLEVFFRDRYTFSDLEQYALDLCEGPILDIGAGAGCHSLYLQHGNMHVSALETSRGGCEVMRLSGIRRIIKQDIHTFNGTGFQTALMMMNGLGLAGSLERLAPFLDHVSSRLIPGGQILADSCDVAYLYHESALPEARFYGEQEYRYEYKGQKDEPFRWLFVDIERLKQEAAKVKLGVQVIFEEDDQYLVRITRSEFQDLR